MNLLNKVLLFALSAVFLVACGQPLSPSLPRKSSSSLNAVQRPQGVSPDCTAWFDGCNSCTLQTNGQTACTYKSCQNYAQPYCLNQGANTGTGTGIQRPAGIPNTCMSWNDGCNDCSVVNNSLGCTYKSCTTYGTPYCKN